MAKMSQGSGSDWGDLGRTPGGNCSSGKGESHGGGRARQIKQGGPGGTDGGVTTGKSSSFGPVRMSGDGNTPATGEKHEKVMGREYVSHLNGNGGAMHTKIPTNIQVDDRGLDASGNDDNGGREKSGQKKAMRVSGDTSRWHGSLPMGNPSFGG